MQLARGLAYPVLLLSLAGACYVPSQPPTTVASPERLGSSVYVAPHPAAHAALERRPAALLDAEALLRDPDSFSSTASSVKWVPKTAGRAEGGPALVASSGEKGVPSNKGGAVPSSGDALPSIPAGQSSDGAAPLRRAFSGLSVSEQALRAQRRQRLNALPPILPDSDLEDPSGRALFPFFDSLQRVAALEQGSQTRVVQLGDSHTAADFMTSKLRRVLQARFGDAGRGFLYPGRAFKYYYQRDVKHGGAGPWEVQNGLRADALEPLGLGGFRLTASTPEARIYAGTCDDCESNRVVSAFELFFWRRPGAGWLQVAVDGAPVRVIDTAEGSSPERLDGETGVYRLELPEGPHKLEAWPTGDLPVDLFGVVLERDVPGVTLDALGINGATIQTSARWTWSLATEQLQRRDPALLITWYGTNESGSRDFSVPGYEQVWRDQLSRLRRMVPDSACLVVGPPDRLMRASSQCKPRKDRRGRPLPLGPQCRWRPAELLDPIIEVQRRVAFEQGCAFWDVRRFMGGAGAMSLWVEQLPPLAQADRVHLTRDGYERVGQAIATDLIDEYERFVSATQPLP